MLKSSHLKRFELVLASRYQSASFTETKARAIGRKAEASKHPYKPLRKTEEKEKEATVSVAAVKEISVYAAAVAVFFWKWYFCGKPEQRRALKPFLSGKDVFAFTPSQPWREFS